MKWVKKKVVFISLISLLIFSLFFGFVGFVSADLDIDLEVVESIDWIYPTGLYESAGLAPIAYTTDTFIIEFDNVYANAGDKISCTIIKSDLSTEILATLPFPLDLVDELVSVSYSLVGSPYDSKNPAPPLTDPTGSADQIWYIDSCSLLDGADSWAVKKSNDEEYPLYIKTSYWWTDNNGDELAADIANVYSSYMSSQRVYFAHNDAGLLDLDFAFKKKMEGKFEGICDDGFDNDGDDGNPGGGIDCADDDCNTIFFPECGHLPVKEDLGGGLLGFVIKGITGLATTPFTCDNGGGEWYWEYLCCK